MLARLAAVALVLSPVAGLAATYDCSVTRGAGAEKKKLWSGPVVLKDNAAGSAVVVVIREDGTGATLDSLVRVASDFAGVRAALKPYDGRLVLGLRRSAGRLDVNLGHVDAAGGEDSAPMDVDAAAPERTRELALTDVRRGLTASCRARGKAAR